MTCRHWTPSELAFLRAHYADTATRHLAAALGRSEAAVSMRALKLGLRKSEAFLAGPYGGRRQPGQTPWNKGLPGSTGLHPSSRRSQFRPGRPASEAHNYRPIGSVRLGKDGLPERKVTDDPAIVPARRWVPVARLVWEQHHGPVPPGHAVVFRPGLASSDPDQITPERLECITRAELMRRNSYHTNLPPELRRLVQLRGALQRQINRRTKAKP